MFDCINQRIQKKASLEKWREVLNKGRVSDREAVAVGNCRIDNLGEIMSMLQEITRRIEKIETHVDLKQ